MDLYLPSFGSLYLTPFPSKAIKSLKLGTQCRDAMVCLPVSTRGCSNGCFCCYLESRMEEARFSREAQLVPCAPATYRLECPRTQLLKHFPHASHQVLLKLLSRIQLPDLSKFMLGFLLAHIRTVAIDSMTKECG